MTGFAPRPPAALAGHGGAWRIVAVGALVHDNLTLNILNFIHRFPAIEAWQKRV